MASYKQAVIRPSSLPSVEQCPRYRPSGDSSAASIDGTIFHEHMEEMINLPREEWDSYTESKDMSPDMKWMVNDALDTLKSMLVENLAPVKNFRIKFRKGGKPFLKKSRLKPGLYTECEVELGKGAHGYLDLMIVPSDGPITIIDWKSSRKESDFTLQLGRYAIAVNELCPAHDQFICCVVAPRLDTEAQLRMPLAKEDIEKLKERIALIEERADWSANDDSIPGCPGDVCTNCRYNGKCKYQAHIMNAVHDELLEKGNTEVENGSVLNVIETFKNLSHGVFSGVRLTLTPKTDAERGFRRAALKAVASLYDVVKKDDTSWVAEHPGVNKVPGFKISVTRGKTVIDKNRQNEFKSALIANFGLSDREVIECSMIDTGLLTEYLASTIGAGKPKEIEKKINRLMEPFTVSGTPIVRWTTSK